MHLLNLSVVLGASLVTAVQASRAKPLHARHGYEYTNDTVPTTSTVTVSPIPVSSPEVSTQVSNVTYTYTQGAGNSTSEVTTTIHSTQTITLTKVSCPEPGQLAKCADVA